MPRETLYVVEDARIKMLEQKIDRLTETIMKLLLEKDAIGDWISEEQAEKISGLGKTKLYELRREGRVRSSNLSDRKIFYKRSDFKKLLDENEN